MWYFITTPVIVYYATVSYAVNDFAAYDTSLSLIFVISHLALFFAYSRKKIIEKIGSFILFLYFLYAFVHNLLVDLSVISGQYTGFLALLCVFFTLILFVWRSFSFFTTSSDSSIMKDTYYLICNEPDLKIQSYVNLLITGKAGSFQIYKNGYIWAYKSGTFVKKQVGDEYINNRKKLKITNDVNESELDDLIGSKWTLFNNCIINFYIKYKTR